MTQLLGALVGLGVWAGLRAAWRAYAPRPASLAERLAAASQPRPPTRRLRQRFLAAVANDLRAEQHGDGTGPGVGGSSGLAADLAVLDRTIEQYAVQRLLLVTSLAVMAVSFAGVTSAVGALQWNPLGVLTFAGLAAGFGFVMARLAVASQAAERRRAFAVELTQYLDVVVLQVAASSGIDEALRRAAAGSTSPGITQIRRALDRARTRNEAAWDSLHALAERIRVPELDELVSTVRLGDDRGARIKATLAAKADALRATQNADELARNEQASERMGIPVVAMFFGFLLLTIAPLLSQLSAL